MKVTWITHTMTNEPEAVTNVLLEWVFFCKSVLLISLTESVWNNRRRSYIATTPFVECCSKVFGQKLQLLVSQSAPWIFLNKRAEEEIFHDTKHRWHHISRGIKFLWCLWSLPIIKRDSPCDQRWAKENNFFCWRVNVAIISAPMHMNDDNFPAQSTSPPPEWLCFDSPLQFLWVTVWVWVFCVYWLIGFV